MLTNLNLVSQSAVGCIEMGKLSHFVALLLSRLLDLAPEAGRRAVDMLKKKADRELKAAQRRQRRERRAEIVVNDQFDDFASLNAQLQEMGLTLKQVTGGSKFQSSF